MHFPFFVLFVFVLIKVAGFSPPSYYLCYEELPNMDADSDTFDPIVVQMWYIGQWVQVKPDPNTESIIDW